MGSDMAWRRLVLHQYWRPGNRRPSRRNANGSQLENRRYRGQMANRGLQGLDNACKGEFAHSAQSAFFGLAGPSNVGLLRGPESIEEPR
jgi:hypothetical protein